MVIGNESIRNGRFGEEKYVALDAGDSFDQALERINADVVEAIPIGEQTTKDEMLDKVEVEESEAENYEGVQAIKMLSRVLSSGKSEVVTRKDIGEINIDKGHGGKGGYGLEHIIEQRFKKDGADADKITALLYLIRDAVENGELSKDGKVKGEGKFGLVKNGVIAIISKERNGKNEKFVVTGYDVWGKEKETAEAIQTVIAQYGYTPEFSNFRKQVGAALSSLGLLSTGLEEKSRSLSEAMKGNDNAKKNGVLLYLIRDAVENGELSKDGKVKGKDKFGLVKNGVIAIISKERNGKNEKFRGYRL